jgi:hypothetical protein
MIKRLIAVFMLVVAMLVIPILAFIDLFFWVVFGVDKPKSLHDLYINYIHDQLI